MGHTIISSAQLILVIGDLHIPYRSHDIPPQLKALLLPKKIQYALITGNLCNGQYVDFFSRLCDHVHIVQGDFDDTLSNYPLQKVISIDGYKIGLIHGHQIVPWGDRESLSIVQRELDVDILISGHTHHVDIYQEDGHLFLNPGSATGAYSGLEKNPPPSFLLLSLNSDKIDIFLYSIVNGELVVKKSTYEGRISEEKKSRVTERERLNVESNQNH